MKITISLNGVEVSREIPTKWKEVTFRQAIKLIEIGSNITKIVSLFTGVDEETLKSNDTKIRNLDKVAALLSFLNRDLPQELPETCMGYPIVKDLESESIAQYGDLETIRGEMVEGDTVGNFNKYPLIVATYAIRPYNWKQAEQLAEHFFDAPCTEVMAIGNFTLAKLMASSNGITRTSRRGWGILRIRSRQAISNYLLRLAFTIRFYLWKRSLPSPVRSFLNGL